MFNEGCFESRDGNFEYKEVGESKRPTIRLEFFRHDEKDGAAPPPGSFDKDVRISLAGRQHASEVGKNKNPNPEMSLAYGSPRKRSTETALRQMLANKTEITDKSTLEDIDNLIKKEVKVGRKNIEDERLNFNWTSNPEYKTIAYQHYNKKKDMLKFIFEESDNLVKKNKDPISTSYSRQASNVAQLIEKYLQILPKWQSVVEQNPEKYNVNNRELQRFMGSHQTVPESFLMKVIEKTSGREAVYDFIDSLTDKNGFVFSEGLTVELLGQEPSIIIKFKDQIWPASKELIEEIIKEQKDLDNSITYEK